MLSRRQFAKAAIATPIVATVLDRPAQASAASGLAAIPPAFAELEADVGGRLGVAILDTKSGAIAGYRADERFPMCSTFKLLAAAAILARVDAGKEQLSRRIRVEQQEILPYAPVTKLHVGGEMSVAALCDAAVTVSDNTAANLLLASLGGPAALTRYVRSLGDKATRLDRIEPDLNEGQPGDPRDTTTPAAMARTIRSLTVGNALSTASRRHLIDWLVDCKTGSAKLRAGLPADWRVGDKTGSGGHGTSNDVAIIWPAGGPPLIITAYLTGTAVPDEKRDATHAAIARKLATALTG